MSKKTIIPPHLFVDENGEVLILRNINADGTSYGGFKSPINAGETVAAPDWKTTNQRGNGIHGWPLGFGLGDGKGPDYTSLWQVIGVKPGDIVPDLEGGTKCKFRTGVVRYSGPWPGAFALLNAQRIAYTLQFSQTSATRESGAASATRWRGAAFATGWRGAASATGERGAASATGERGAASATGESGAASATRESGAASATGERGAASATGWSGAASATGERGAASATGESSAAVCTGLDSKAMAGPLGVIALQWWNPKRNRREMRCARVDGERIKPNVWYQMDKSGKFVVA